MSARVELQLAAAHLQLAAARSIIEALLQDGDPPDVEFARTAAGEWLRTNQARYEETLNALGSLLTGGGE